MLRLVFFIHIITNSFLSFSQQSSSADRNNGLFEIVCYNKEIKTYKDLHFVFRLTNFFADSVKTYSYYHATPLRYGFAPIGYEVIYIQKGKEINYGDSIFVHIHGNGPYERNQLLTIGQSQLFELDIANFLFPRKGAYKVRFFFWAAAFPGILKKDAVTKWVYLNVQTKL